MGRRLLGGEVIELISDLGGGKTAFVKGLAKGMGSKDSVHSPSFTLSNQYVAENKVLYHFDFYRLDDPGILRNGLKEILEDASSIVAIEWPSIASNIIPEDHISVEISPTGINDREFKFVYPIKYNYLFPDNA